jgi:hypothetical protein
LIQNCRWKAVLLLTAAIASTAGCFKYAAIDPGSVNPQEEVRVRVTNDAAVRIGPYLGTVTENLEGRLTPLSPDSLALSIWIGKDYRGTPFEDSRQRVSLGARELVEVRRRELSLQRTGIAAAGVVAVTALLISKVVFEPNPNPGGSGRPGPPPTDDRVMIRIPFGLIR